jgi:hypothetical protein
MSKYTLINSLNANFFKKDMILIRVRLYIKEIGEIAWPCHIGDKHVVFYVDSAVRKLPRFMTGLLSGFVA